MNDGVFNLADVDGTNGFVIRGVDEDDRSGERSRSVSNAGDVNGDGIDDIIISAPSADVRGYYGNEGESYVVFGSNDGFDGAVELSDLNGNNGFILRGIDNRDLSGISVSGAGDVNGDGIDDIIIGAPDADVNDSDEGESYVVFGSNDGFDEVLELSDLNGNNGFVLRGRNVDDSSGISVSGAGDVNGDGIDDIIISATGADVRRYDSDEGESYVVFGRSDGFDEILELSNLNGNNGFVIQGVYDGDGFVLSVSGAGDINGDGVDDLIIGASRANSISKYRDSGESYVVFGRSNGFDEILELSNLNGNNGFVLAGVYDYDFSGGSVSGAGDINGDGIDDIIIGASGASVTSVYTFTGEGKSYVVFGSNDGFDAVLKLSDLDGSNGFVFEGVDEGDSSGSSVSGAGDINGDGVDDLIIGAPGADVSGNGSDEGETYVIFGVQPLNITGTNKNDLLRGDQRDDTISGLRGKDTIDGLGGNDTISGGLGKDTIDGGQGNDQIKGGGGKDNIFGNQGNDTISGGFGKDTISGGDGDDDIKGNSGADVISGGAGDDLLNGGAGKDRLSGVDISTFGVGEMDTLQGGAGKDIFVLGNAEGVFYDDGDASTTGEDDFALVKDFNERRDVIELQGDLDLYRLDLFASGAGSTNASLIYDPGVSGREELIAILEDVSGDLSLSDINFRFVV